MLKSNRYFSVHCILTFLLICLSPPTAVVAQEINKRGLGSGGGTGANGAYNSGLDTTLGTLIREGEKSDNYHPLTIKELRRLREDNEPYWLKDDADVERVERATQKAFFIQGAHHLSFVIKDSELRFVYRDIQDSLKSIRDYFRFSLQSDGDSMSLSRKQQGKKLLELDVQLNLKQGVDPQIRIGEYMRFRYDYTYDGTFLEYAVDF